MISEVKSEFEERADTQSEHAFRCHDKAFSDVQSYAILKDGQFVGSVSFKWPRTNPGSGLVRCFVFSAGEGMVTGAATGFHTDKATVAVSTALNGALFRGTPIYHATTDHDWKRQLENAGFQVFAVIHS